MWHIETDYLALILFIIMMVKNRRSFYEKDRQRQDLFAILTVCLASCIVDMAASYAMNYPYSWIFFEVSLTIYYALMPIVTAAWVAYMMSLVSTDDPGKRRKRILLAILPSAAYSVIGLSNPVTGCFFTLSSDMVYARGPLFYPVAVGFYMGYSLLALVLLFINRKKITPFSNMFFLAAFFISSLFIPVIQVMHPGWLIAESAYAVLYVLCDATVEEEHRNTLLQKIREQNTALEAAVRKAEEASRAKSEFLSRMSHDMRTPLNGIIGMTYLTRKMTLPAEAQDHLAKIDVSSKFLLSLINDVLDMAKAESGMIELHPEPYPPHTFESYLDAVIRPLCREKGQKLIIDDAGIKGIIPVMDELRMNQIYFNLFSNAVKYTPENGTIIYHQRGTLTDDGRLRMQISISDSGIGMSPEFQKILFEPFTQEAQDDFRERHGTGLGLTIVGKLVETMGGTIEVRSSPGKGSTFTVTVTVDYVREDSQAAAVPEARPKAAGPGEDGGKPAEKQAGMMAGKHILLCEDHPLNQEIAKAMLKEKGILVETAEDGRLGVEAFRRSPVGFYSLILMDIHMPVMNGYEATEAIRALGREDAASVPIIAMTADAFTEDRQKCLDAGMNGHLAKPIDAAELFRTVESYIAG